MPTTGLPLCEHKRDCTWKRWQWQSHPLSLLMAFLRYASPLELIWWCLSLDWHALIIWQSSSWYNRRCFPVLLTPNVILIYQRWLSLIAPWQRKRQTPPSPSKDCHLINRQVSLRIYSPALSCYSPYSVTQACEGSLHLSLHFNNRISANPSLWQLSGFTSQAPMEKAVNQMNSPHLTFPSLPGCWSQTSVL